MFSHNRSLLRWEKLWKRAKWKCLSTLMYVTMLLACREQLVEECFHQRVGYNSISFSLYLSFFLSVIYLLLSSIPFLLHLPFFLSSPPFLSLFLFLPISRTRSLVAGAVESSWCGWYHNSIQLSSFRVRLESQYCHGLWELHCLVRKEMV